MISRAEAEAYLAQLLKEITGNYSCAERRAMECAEAANYNRHISSASWWAGSDTFVDFYGCVREVGDVQ